MQQYLHPTYLPKFLLLFLYNIHKHYTEYNCIILSCVTIYILLTYNIVMFCINICVYSLCSFFVNKTDRMTETINIIKYQIIHRYI